MAIVGGGCAGLAAAWELTRPGVERDEHYEVTVYERSWRLGGKGASGRDEYGRIREHGIHIWLGFYENAFRMMRECYEVVEGKKWGPRGETSVLPFGRFDAAFFPEPHVGVAASDGQHSMQVWSGLLPPVEGLPGTDLDEETNPFTLQAYLMRALDMLKALIHSMLGPADLPQAPDRTGRRGSPLDQTLDLNFSLDPIGSPEVIVERAATLLRAGALTTAAGVMQGVTILESFLRERDPAPHIAEGLLKFIEALTRQVRRQLRDFVSIDPSIRLKTQIIDLVMTIAVGVFRERLLTDPHGLDAINHIDCKEWLRRHGAVDDSINSPFVTGLYDLAFCYRDGDRSKPALAAGQALRGALRMFFSYRGSIFWRMRGGMGETVFSPLFRVLQDRGVTFKFMHELQEVTFGTDDGETRVNRLTFAKSEATDGFSDSEPLDHFGCWRHTRPITGRSKTSVTCDDGTHFDAVVFAMGVDDFIEVCPALLSPPNRRWSDMKKHVKTIPTQAAQVWLTKDLPALGWKRGSVLISALDHPFETWADMTHTLAAERAWRAHPKAPATAKKAGAAVRSTAYFCGVLNQADVNSAGGSESPNAQGKLEQKVRDELEELLRERMRVLWPDEKDPMALLATADGRAGGSLTDQHIQASFCRSDRYTLALPGSIEYRISPLERLVANMTIAGDWTECGFNEGCIEAAVMSGMLAAHAISGRPALDNIIGYNHP